MEKQILEIRVPKDSEETPEASAALFASFSNLRTALLARMAGKRKCLVFEIALFDQMIRFYSVVDSDFEPYFVSQLTAQYPKAVVSRVKDYLSVWDWRKVAFCQMSAKAIECLRHRRAGRQDKGLCVLQRVLLVREERIELYFSDNLRWCGYSRV